MSAQQLQYDLVDSDNPIFHSRSGLHDPSKTVSSPTAKIVRIASVVILIGIFGTLVALVIAYSLALDTINDYKDSTYALQWRHPGDSNVFVHLTDLHFNQLYNESLSCASACMNGRVNWPSGNSWPQCNSVPFAIEDAAEAPFGRLGCDSPELLVDTVLDRVARVHPSPLMVLLSGDNLLHDVYLLDPALVADPAAFMQEGHARLAANLAARFPNSPILFSLGNNDSPLHYDVPGADFLSALAATWRPLIDGGPRRAGVTWSDFRYLESDFFYAVELAAFPEVRWVQVNSIAFARKQTAVDWGRVQQQLSWLRETLGDVAARSTKARRVVITGHIPPVVDDWNGCQGWITDVVTSDPACPPGFSTTNNSTTGSGVLVDVAAEFTSLVSEFRSVVQSTLWGHVHQDKLSLLTGNYVATPPFGDAVANVLMTRSVSVGSGSNLPGFREYAVSIARDYQPGGDLLNFRQHQFDVFGANKLANAGLTSRLNSAGCTAEKRLKQNDPASAIAAATRGEGEEKSGVLSAAVNASVAGLWSAYDLRTLLALPLWFYGPDRSLLRADNDSAAIFSNLQDKTSFDVLSPAKLAKSLEIIREHAVLLATYVTARNGWNVATSVPAVDTAAGDLHVCGLVPGVAQHPAAYQACQTKQGL